MLVRTSADNSPTCLENTFDSTNSNQTTSSFLPCVVTIPLSRIGVKQEESLGWRNGATLTKGPADEKASKTTSDGHPITLHSVLVRQATRHLRCHAACTGTE